MRPSMQAEERPLGALVRGVLAGLEADVGSDSAKPFVLRRVESREDRDPRNLFDRHHDWRSGCPTSVGHLHSRSRLNMDQRYCVVSGSAAPRFQLCLASRMISETTLSSLELAEELRPALLRLARNLRRETEALGVTSHQVTLLWLVRNHPGLSLRELAYEEGISAPSLSGHVDRLEAAGFSRRSGRPTTGGASVSS